MSTHKAIFLDQLKELFRDESAFHDFVELFKSASQSDLTAIFSGDEMLGAVLSPGGAKDVLYDRFLKRITDNPDLLSEIADRLEQDEIVE